MILPIVISRQVVFGNEARSSARIAFIIDIRRQNMLEHLFYKALMETSADRAEFLSRLFARDPVDSTPNSHPKRCFARTN